jgi:acyl dehydratase
MSDEDFSAFSSDSRFDARFEVTERIYDAFLEMSRDANPLHANEDFAKARGFRGRVMHGNILGAFVSHLVGECLPVKNVVIHSQTINFHAPVYLGDRLSLSAVVSDLHESVRAVELKFTFLNGEGVKVAAGKVQVGLLP